VKGDALEVVTSRKQQVIYEALDIAKARRRIIVVVHQAVMVAARRSALLDNQTCAFKSGAAVIKSTGYIDGGFLHCAVDAVCRRIAGHWRLSARFQAPSLERIFAASRTIFWSNALGLTSWEASRPKLSVGDDANCVTRNQPYSVRKMPQPPA